MQHYDYVFWDWNGTIIDDLKINLEVINLLLKKYNQDTITLNDYRGIFSFPIKSFYGKIGLPVNDDEYERLVNDYWSLYNNRIKHISLMEGIADILSTLNKNNIKQYILSASNKKTIYNQINQYGILLFFEDIIAPDNGFALGKEKLAILWMSNHGIVPSNAIMIGDTLYDYFIANKIGVDCALVDIGHQNLKLYNNYSKLTIFNTVNELRCFLL